MVIFLKLLIRAEVPGGSELSPGQDWVARHRPLPTHILLWDFPWLFALAGRGGQTLTWPLPLWLVWQSGGPWWAMIQGFVFPFHHDRVLFSPCHCWPLFLQGGWLGSWRSCLRKGLWVRSRVFLIPIWWVGSEFPSPNLCIPREVAVERIQTPLVFSLGFTEPCRKWTVMWSV